MSDAKKMIATAAVKALLNVADAYIERDANLKAAAAAGSTALPVVVEWVDKILHAIVAIADEVRKGLDGEVSAEAIEESIRSIEQKMFENDVTIDDAIDLKFPKDDGTTP